MRVFCIVMIFFMIVGCHSHSRNPQAAYYNAQLGLLYTQKGFYPQARAKVYHALEMDSHSAYAHYAVAFYEQKTHQWHEAQKHYQQALSLAPGNGELHENYAIFLCEQRKFPQALEHFSHAAQDLNYPWVDRVYQHAGECAMQIPDRQLAQSYFEKSQQFREP